MGKTNRDWYKHHPRAPVVKERIGGNNIWRYQEEDEHEAALENAKSIEDRVQVSASAARHADQLFEQMSRANMLAADAERQFSAAAPSAGGVGELDVGKLEACVSALPLEIRLNLDGALDRPMCPPSFIAAEPHDYGEEEEEEGATAGGAGGAVGSELDDLLVGAAAGGAGEPDTTGDDEIDALLDM